MTATELTATATDRDRNILQDFTICNEIELRAGAAELKFQRSISLADCYSIAVARRKQIPIFMKKEAEILEEMQKKPFEEEIRFIDDFVEEV